MCQETNFRFIQLSVALPEITISKAKLFYVRSKVLFNHFNLPKGPYFNYVSTKGYILGLQNANYSTVRVVRYCSKNANKGT